MSKGLRVLVTGAAGMVGRKFCERLAREEILRRTIKTLAGHGGEGHSERLGLLTLTPMQEAAGSVASVADPSAGEALGRALGG